MREKENETKTNLLRMQQRWSPPNRRSARSVWHAVSPVRIGTRLSTRAVGRSTAISLRSPRIAKTTHPDLPKNYQISQYDLPFSYEGWLEINAAADPKKEYKPKRIGIIRAHLEEDAGKNMHDESGRGGDSKVDLNRTGTPLLEIVSKPEINARRSEGLPRRNAFDARESASPIARCRKRSLRCDANVTIHVPQSDGSVAATLWSGGNLNSIAPSAGRLPMRPLGSLRSFKDLENYRFGKRAKSTAGWIDAAASRCARVRCPISLLSRPIVPVVVAHAEIEKPRLWENFRRAK
jgi:aspartyl-tRNA(Asn)/glutamyl-tRNA(Gln) amidotransferase subunit B